MQPPMQPPTPSARERLPLDALHAAAAGDEAALAAWLDNGGNVDAREVDTQRTLLMAASYAGRVGAVALLLDRRASPDLRNRYGSTALICAANQGSLATASLLLSAGAHAAMRSASGSTAEQHAANQGHSAVEQLLRSHASERPSAAPGAGPASPEDVSLSV